MKAASLFCLLFGIILALPGCGPLRAEAGFESPAQLTATTRSQARPAITPHLGKLAYVQFGDIWIKDLSTGEAKRFTEVGRDSRPRWSPTGQWLAFLEDSHLWIERADGTDAHVVQGGATIGQYAWSPVEDRLAYTERGALSMETADGGRLWQLVRATGSGHGVSHLAWASDGRSIAFDRVDRTLQGIWQVAAEGSGSRAVYRNPNPVELAGWSPDGNSLLFWQATQWSASLLADGASLMAVRIGGGGRHQIAHTLLYRDFLSWSPDRRRLALIDGGNRITWDNKALAIATVRGTWHRLQVDHTTATRYASLFPAWSPDGRWIAVTRSPAVRQTGGGDVAGVAVQRRHIRLVASDGSTARQLTKGSAFRDERPLWSADGSSILFVRLGGKFAQLWLMQADGSHQRLVADGLAPGPSLGFWGYYGYVQWGQMYDWWTGSAGQTSS